MYFDRRFLTVVAVSLVWALLVAGVFYRLAGGSAGRGHVTLRQVVIASKALPVGSTVDRASVSLRALPEGAAPPGAFSRVEDVLDRPVIEEIQADEPLVEARLAVKGSGAGLGPLIPPGMRAVSVRVNDVVGVAGFVLPGMRVDVLVTGKPPDGSDTGTQTVLQNIAVLSAGQTIQSDPKSQPIATPVVTLLVSPSEAEALALANSEGHIQLVLRNSTDRALTATGGRWLHQLYGTPPPASAAPAPVRSVSAAVKPAHLPAPAVATPVPVAVPVAEPDRMIVIQGAVRKVEVFGGAKK